MTGLNPFFPHSATTRDVVVRVAVSFLPEQSEPAKGRWFWTYHIRIENESDGAIQLLHRHWTITDGRGGKHEVRGEGVVGEQPVLRPGQSYEYTSGTPLHTPSGIMGGSYRMTTEKGEEFDITIPTFSLDSPYGAPQIH